jgi:hypothetical protein
MTRSLLSAGLMLCHAAAAFAWSETPPPAPDAEEVGLTEPLAVADSGREARIEREFPNFVSVAAEIAVNLADGDGFVYVYDAGGVLQEIIPTALIAAETVWTDPVDGDGLTLTLAVDGNTQGELTWSQVVGVSRSDAERDAAPDGIWHLDEVVHDDGSPSSVDAVAALVVGRNALPPQPSVMPSKSVPCTGFLVTKDLLMTASHCLLGQSDFCEQTIAVFGFERGDRKSFARKCEEIVYMNRSLDVALLRLLPSDGDLPTIPLQFVGPSDTAVSVIQHPRGGIKLISRPGCRITMSHAEGLRSYDDLIRSDLDGLGFEHDCDTIDGSSGSPVLAADGLVGVHLGSRPDANGGVTNVGVRSARIAQCIKIDPQTGTVTVLQPDTNVCKDES